MARTAVAVALVFAACGSDAKAPSGSPARLEVAECRDTGACAAGFRIGDRFHSISCGAVRPELVTDDVIATGSYRNAGTEVRRIADVDPNVLVAVNIPGGMCADEDKVALSPWSMLFVADANRDATQRATCAAAVPEHLERNNCKH